MDQNIESFFRVAIGVVALVLLGVGGFLIFSDKAKSAFTALAFGFLLVVIVFLSKFKHFEAWGFKAETWDQKQVEAAALVDRLKLISDATSEQVALIAAKLGLWDSGLTNPELNALLTQVRKLLEAADVSKTRRDEILGPAYRRVELNYFFAAQRRVELVFKGIHESLEAARSAASSDQLSSINEKSVILQAEQRKFHQGVSALAIKSENPVGPIVSFVKQTSLFRDNHELTNDLSEIDLDLKFFKQNRTLRRPIDFSYLFR